MSRPSSVKTCNKCKQSKPRQEFILGIGGNERGIERLELSQFCELCRTELETCSRCSQGKAVCEFNHASRRYGWCRQRHKEVRQGFYREMAKTIREHAADEIPAGTLWYDQDPDEVRKRPDRRRRERLRAVPRERIDRSAIYERDGWICGICGEPVKTEEATLDHVVPVALGGEHTMSNLRPAHSLCNSQRQADT